MKLKTNEAQRFYDAGVMSAKQNHAQNQASEDQAADSAKAALAKAEQAAKKKLSEMNLLDDFLFGSVVTYPEIGEKFICCLLKTILGRKVKHLSVTAQKVFYGADSDLHGARLDVCLEPEIEEGLEGNATVYDIEPENGAGRSDRRALPRRMRFYHGKIAARSLKAGEAYEDLKNTIVIMIMPFDPFGLNRMMYTIKSRCVEAPEMEYEDGASTIYLYTRGAEGIPSEAVRQLLRYMEDTTYENAVNEDLRDIHRMVEIVKKDHKVAKMRIKIVEDLMMQAEEIARQSEEITRQSEEITGLEEEITGLEEEITKQSDKITRLEEEIQKLREELDRRNCELSVCPVGTRSNG